MTTSRHRSNARIVGYIDMVLSCLGLLILLVSIVGCVVVTLAYNSDNAEMAQQLHKLFPDIDPGNVQEALRPVLWIMWIAVAISTPLTIFQLYASKKLIDSTEIGKDPSEAYKTAMLWRNVSILLLVTTVLSGLIFWFTAVISVIIRFVFLYFVRGFIMEVEGPAVIEAASNAPTTPWRGPDKYKV